MKNMLIGLFVAGACALMIGMILFLEPSAGDGDQTLIMRFSNINGINVGTRVMFAGKPVGEVVKIESIPDARDQPSDQLGQLYFYQLVLKIDSQVKVYNTDEFTIATSGLLGEKSVSIIPKRPPMGISPRRLSSKTPIYADSISGFESTFNDLTSVADKIEEMIGKVNVWIDDNGKALGSAIRSFDDAMSAAAITVDRVNKLHVVDDTAVALQNFGDVMEGADKALKTLHQENAFANAGETMKNLKTATGSFNTIMTKLDKGDSTLGRLLSRDDLYLQVQSLLTKASTLMNDVNNYGLFFNLNKSWQKGRAAEVTALNSLQTPQEFRAYFEKEVDHINRSMQRISMLVEKAEDAPAKDRVLESVRFKKDFAELMRKAELLTDNLKMYNDQLLMQECE